MIHGQTPRPEPPPPSSAWAFFLDVDGTLLDLASTPAAVRLEPHVHAVIRDLHAHSNGALALVSGRAIAEIDAIFGAPPLPVAGQHGHEIRSASRPVEAPHSDLLRDARATLTTFVARHDGLLLEDKGTSLAVHYRSAPSLAGVVHRVVRTQLAGVAGTHRVQRGKCVVELRPALGDKGAAIGAFMQAPPFGGRTPVFIGDDVTDEDGFMQVNALGGHSVRVGPGRSSARWRLRDTHAVHAWLARALPSAGTP